MRHTYFDHNATTPLDPRVRAAMLPWLGEHHGNPSSVHSFGRQAQEAVEEAREQTARLIGAAPLELVFTAALVEELGVEVTRVAPAADGRVDPSTLLAALRDDTFLVCLMLANNELGTLQPVAEVARGCRERGVAVLCDAVQAVGKIPVGVEDLDVDYLTLGAHKFYGPLGAAALWIRKGAELTALLIGGGQERHRRASTVNVPAVVGLGTAAEIARKEMDERQQQLAALRDRFEDGLSELDVVVHGDSVPRLPNTSHIALRGVDGEALMIRLDLAGYAVSTGAACSSGTVEPSKTLLALGMTSEEALSSLRVSFGISNTAAEVDAFLEILTKEAALLRSRAAGEPEP
jgi:cysteine desulfurase